jgi:hypothetical protein
MLRISKIELFVTIKNVPMFDIITLTVHKNTNKMDLSLQAILITSDFYCMFLHECILQTTRLTQSDCQLLMRQDSLLCPEQTRIAVLK